MAKQTADQGFVAKGLSAIASLGKVERGNRKNISTDEVDAAHAHSNRFEATFASTTRETLKQQAKTEIDAVTPKKSRKRQKVRPERLSCRTYAGTKAVLMAIAKEAGDEQLTVGLEILVTRYCKEHGLPVPGSDDDA
jgi:hypothetical protein